MWRIALLVLALSSVASATFEEIYNDPMQAGSPPDPLDKDVTAKWTVVDITADSSEDGRPIFTDENAGKLAGPFKANTEVLLTLNNLPEAHDSLEVTVNFRIYGNWRGHMSGVETQLDYMSFTVDDKVFVDVGTVCTLDSGTSEWQAFPFSWNPDMGAEGGTGCRANTRGGSTRDELAYSGGGASDAYAMKHRFEGHSSAKAEIRLFGVGYGDPAQTVDVQAFFIESVVVAVNLPDLFLGFLPISDPRLGWAIVISACLVVIFSVAIIRKAIRDGREARRFGGARLSRAPKGYVSQRSDGSRSNAKMKSRVPRKGTMKKEDTPVEAKASPEVSGPVIPGPNEVTSKKRGASPKRKKTATSKARGSSPNRKRKDKHKDKDHKGDKGGDLIDGAAAAALEAAPAGDDAKHFTLNPAYDDTDDTPVNLDSRADQKARLAELMVSAPLPSEQSKKGKKVKQEGNI